jgi:hypothetical protein
VAEEVKEYFTAKYEGLTAAEGREILEIVGHRSY